MLTKRHSALDSGLYELTRAAEEADLLISDTFDQPPADAVIDPEAAPHEAGPCHAASCGGPPEKLTVKLIIAAGSEDALSARLAEFSATDIDAALNGAGNVPAGELTGVVWIDVPTRPSLSCQCLYNEGRQGGANDPKHDACCRDMLCF